MTREVLVSRVAAQLHADDLMGAAASVARFSNLPEDAAYDEPSAQALCSSLLYWCLNNDRYEWAAELLWGETLFTPRPRATQLIWRELKASNSLMLMGAASMSKCLSPDTLCRRFDGSFVRADEVRVGDELAGDDGTPRRVLNTVTGRAPMYEVSPVGAAPFKCNEDHLLSLVCTLEKRNHSGRYGVSSGYTPGKVVDVSVKEYLGWSDQRKRAYRLFSRPAHFPEQPIIVDPYIYGAWLGDGTSCRAELTTPDGPMARRWREYWGEEGFRTDRVTNASKTCPSWFVRAADAGSDVWPNRWFRESSQTGGKRIRREYLANSEANRLKLLAGLLDSDGCLTPGGYDFVSKWWSLSRDVAELARGLGFRVTEVARKHCIKSTGFTGEYYHVRIMGEVSKIPCVEKPAGKRQRGVINGDPTYSFEVKSLGVGDYAGFTVDRNHRFLLGNGIVTHNSYSVGVWLLLDWLRDPEYTTINLVGPSEDHLKDNLFTHLVTLHRSSSLPLPGEIGDLFIGLDNKARKGAIRGVVIPLGKRPAGRLQGRKRVPRKTPHPQFGKMSRMRIFLDELEKVPVGVWKDIDNVFANLDSDPEGFKVIGAFNPEDPHGNVAARCEPTKGWNEFDIENDEVWVSKRGWKVVRLDAAKCENVVNKNTVFPGLQTHEGYQRIIENSGGLGSPGYLTMARAVFPITGAIFTVFPTLLLYRMRGEVLFAESPLNFGACDLALEGGDAAQFAFGRFGKAFGFKTAPTLEYPQGRIIKFSAPDGSPALRPVLAVDQLFTLPSGDTVKMATQIRDLCVKLAIPPQQVCLDRTGNGAGVHDLLKGMWSDRVMGLNYTEGATERKILEEDSKTAKEEYERVVSELWFALKKWSEFDLVKLGHLAISDELDRELGGRRYAAGKLTKVETKKEYKSRNNPSPNSADAVTLLLHCVRVVTGVVPSALRADIGEIGALLPDSESVVPTISDPTNVYDSLEG